MVQEIIEQEFLWLIKRDFTSSNEKWFPLDHFLPFPPLLTGTPSIQFQVLFTKS